MPQLIVPNAAQMRLIWAHSGQLYALNVMGVVNAGNIAITQALVNAVGAAIKTGFGTSFLNAAVSSAVQLTNVGLRDIRTPNTSELIDTGAAVAGTAGTDFLPPQTAFCVTLRTAFAGRSFRGRCYLPGFAEVQNTAAGVNTDPSTATAFVAAIKAALISNALDLGVISRPNPDATPPRVGSINTVTAIVSRDGVWDTQRRRAVPGI